MRRKEREVTDAGEIREILDECKVCRLGLSDEDGIYMVPMNYGYREQDGKLILYFHGAKEGKKVEMIRKDPRAGFEMDCCHGLQEGEKACQYSYYFASVIGTGKAQILEDPAEKLTALEIIMKHQTGKEFTEFRENPGLEKTVGIIKLEVETYTCKRHVS